MSLHYTAWYSPTPTYPPTPFSLFGSVASCPPFQFWWQSHNRISSFSPPDYVFCCTAGSSPCPVTGMRLIGILIFKNLINDFWQAVATLINANHRGWCVGVKVYIFMRQVGRGLCNHHVNVLSSQWVLPRNYMSTQRQKVSRSRQPMAVIVKSFCEALITCCPRDSLSGD